MMVIMTHPLHGRLPVYSVSEVESNKLAGWTVEEAAPETKTLEAAPTPPSAASEAEAPAKPKRKSFLAGLADDSEV